MYTRLSIFLACLFSFMVFMENASASEPDSESPTSKSVMMIDKTVENLSDDASQRHRQLRQLAQQVIEREEANVLVQDRLKTALQESGKKESGKAAGMLEVALLQAKVTLAFQPLREAKLPQGFPEPTPVGEIQVKEYPTYRLARTEMKGGPNGSFGVLFNHIKQNEIAMTAPVEMTYGKGKGDKVAEKSMAFLYGSPAIGETNSTGKVKVVDIPAMTTLSMGLRGNYDREQISKARQYLETWLSKHSDQYEVAGDLRVMGYNSPMVPSAMRYAEVEIPIREK